MKAIASVRLTGTSVSSSFSVAIHVASRVLRIFCAILSIALSLVERGLIGRQRRAQNSAKQYDYSSHHAFSTVIPTRSIPFNKYPDGFHADTIGCTFPAASVARERIV